ncbi:hypothetical protein OIY81_387 [Cryptosporidium canis]|nr:hypothetical protein OIY81_387 [Cryptosporidium canis]
MQNDVGATDEALKAYENATVFCFCKDSKLNSQTDFRKFIVQGMEEYLLKETHLAPICTILIGLLIDNELFHESCTKLKKFSCTNCLTKLLCVQKFEESDLEDYVYLIGMIFTKFQLRSICIKMVNMDQVTTCLIELIQNCIHYKFVHIKSMDDNQNTKKYSSRIDELIIQVLSIGMTQLSLGNYDDAYQALSYISREYPDIDRLMNCLKVAILILFKASIPGDLEKKSNKYFAECYLHFPSIIHCFIRSKLHLIGVDLNQPPLDSIITGSPKDPEIYSKCRDLLEECLVLNEASVNYEIEYTLSRLYFEVDGDADKSLHIMEKLLEKTPFNENYRLYTGKILYFKAIEAKNNNSELLIVKSILKRVMFYIPQSSEVYCDLGIVYYELGKKEKAIWCFKLSVYFNPMNIHTYYNFGTILRKLGFVDLAISCYERIFKINPSCVNTLNIIATLYGNIGKIDESFDYFRKCLEANRESPDVFNNLGVLYRDCGNFLMAKNCFLVALKLDPNHVMAFQNLLYILNYFIPINNIKLAKKASSCSNESIINYLSSSVNPCLNINNIPDLYLCKNQNWISNSDYYIYYNDMYELSLEWGDKFIEMHRDTKLRLDELIPISDVPDIKSLSGTESINIGFVGAEFFHHAVAFFTFAPIKFLIKNYSRDSSNSKSSVNHPVINFNVFIYDNSPNHDYYSCFFKEVVPNGNWRYIHGKDIEYASRLIRNDKIHILFDLSGHTVNNCLALFAVRNSPIQISWIGYPNTTGLRCMDYRITDRIADPINTEQRYSEKLLYLPHCFLCYSLPKIQYPPITELPSIKNGFITFGSFNRVTKLHPLTIDLWGEVLKTVPNSHLLLKSKAFSSTSCCNFYLDVFKSKYGIEPHRISLVPLTNSYYHHLELYNKIDISLDTFPYSGTTTTFECIFMGVPIITLSIDRSITNESDPLDFYSEISSFHSQNVGKSILTHLNMEEFITGSRDDFIRVASDLASNLERLSFYRSNLRSILANSKICDGEMFSRELFETIFNVLKCHNKKTLQHEYN